MSKNSSDKTGQPVLAIIDDRIGFLHQQFRDAQGYSRIQSLWDQSDTLPVGDWERPARMGYGRRLSQSAIDRCLLDLARDGNEARVYKSLDQPWEDWTHGTHVLALMAGRLDPLTQAPDAASEFPIVAVQVPRSAFDNTHGNWLNVYVLDALHYILDEAPAQAPVIVTVSLGGHSGPHDSSAMLDRAIDDLIEREAGRLTVVVAAGNSREVGAHASFVLPAAPAGGQSREELFIDVERADESSNFVELWAQFDSIHAELLSFELGPVNGNSVSVAASLAGTAVRVMRREPANAPIAMLYVSPPGGGPNGLSGIQAWVGLAQGLAGPGDGWPANPYGRWRIAVISQAPVPIAVDAWVARDDGVGTGNTQQRRHLSFRAEKTSAGLISRDRTLSSLAWSRHAVVVGGYAYDLESGIYSLCEDSAAGRPDASAGQRRGPDLCGPALFKRGSNERSVGRVGFFSPRPMAPDPEAGAPTRRGTSLAAPVVARRLAGLLADRGCLSKAGLLQALRQQAASAPVAKPEHSHWVSDYWLALSGVRL
ncbi:S8 family serine peptidase [Roseateles cavernae]|uniref:S8 family serine peptidase n=1 Tax=Roseateles cavernae TaxID=3153578 RepID=UPI0032E429FC